MSSDEPASHEDVLRFRAKREIRKRMRAVRAAFPRASITERSARIEANVRALDAWRTARTIALFSAMPDEVQTDGLIEHALAEGRRVALPRVVDETRVLEFRAPFDGGTRRALVPSAYGIDEPGDDAPFVDPATIDLLVIPALAIDPRGHRIGYGGGYYDHTLQLATRAVRVVVAFDFQLIAEVPERTGDIASHWIVTDARTLAADDPPPRPPPSFLR